MQTTSEVSDLLLRGL